MRDRPPILCILVDAFRHDYLDEDATPHIAGLARRGTFARMRPILGYSDSIRATIFTGHYPDEHGYWMEYCYRPESSPYRPLDRLAPIDRLPSDFLQRCVKFGISQTVGRALAARRGYDHLSVRHFPFRSLGQFDWTLREDMTADGALGMPTFFDELTAAGVPWEYLDASKIGAKRVLERMSEVPSDTALTFVYLHQIDMASHVFGIDARMFRRVVRRTDALTGEVVRRFQARNPDGAVVAFSDHGMSRVDRLVSCNDLWTHPAFPDRFLFALDATMVRLWFHDGDQRLREEIRERVRSMAPGRYLEQDEIEELHLDFDGRLYGDEIYLLEPRIAIFPNFHSMLKPKAMHAYHPDDPDQQGIFIAPSDHEAGETVELVRVSELCRELAGLKTARS